MVDYRKSLASHSDRDEHKDKKIIVHLLSSVAWTVKNLPCNAGGPGLIHRLILGWRRLWRRDVLPIQWLPIENSMDWRAWQAESMKSTKRVDDWHELKWLSTHFLTPRSVQLSLVMKRSKWSHSIIFASYLVILLSPRQPSLVGDGVVRENNKAIISWATPHCGSSWRINIVYMDSRNVFPLPC